MAFYVFIFLVGGGCVWCLWTGYRVRKGNSGNSNVIAP